MVAQPTITGSQTHPMSVLFNQVKVAAAMNLYYAALFAALTIPDICGAMDVPGGVATRATYEAWFDQWVSPRYQVQGNTTLTGPEAWRLRCSMLHQGRALNSGPTYDIFAFLPDAKMHNIAFQNVSINVCV